MRALPILALCLLLAGCAAAPADLASDRTSEAAGTASLPDSVVLNEATYILGASVPGATDFQAVLGLDVPAERTRLTIEVTLTHGVAADLRMWGIERCEHDFGLAYVPGEAMAFECTSPAGAQALRFAQASPQAGFGVRVIGTQA